MKTFKQVIEDINLHPGHSIKHHYPGKDIPKGYHLMPDGQIMKDSDHEDKPENEVDEVVSPAQRRARKQAYLKKTMAKYGLATKMGIPASQVNQRRSHPTRKKT